MANDMVKCPLCDGFSQISRAELMRVLTDKDLAEKVERFVAGLTHPTEAAEQPVAAHAAASSSDFQKQVHSWNPANPMWRRSPKE